MNPKRILPHLVIAAFTGVVVAGVVVRQNVERNWRSMLVTLEELRAERLGRPALRDALHGATRDEQAWPHYERALAVLASIDEARDRCLAAPRATSEEERAERDALLAEAEAMFPHLARGAHARDARTAHAVDDGLPVKIQRLFDVSSVCELSVAHAIQRLERGQDLDAVAALLDAQQLARDLAVSPVLIEEMIGLSQLVPTGMEEWLAAGGLNAMSTSSVGVWLDGLDALRASLPSSSRAIVSEVEMFGREVLRQSEATGRLDWDGALEGAPLWRYGFSWRGAAADYVVRATDLARQVERAFDDGPLEVVARLEGLERIAGADQNPIYAVATPKIASAGRARIWQLARLDFLRHALALRLQRPTDLPEDPFGTGVRVEQDEDGIRVWAEAGRYTSDVSIELGT
ncbi:MAG: hypothetical protein AAGB93_09150 [Planctomycetota bacterium]